MPVIAVVNRKGGSGKTTLATHLAVSCAADGAAVMLADVDRQQSTQAWLRRRARQRVTLRSVIKGRAVEPNTVIRPPSGYAHVVLDTPGGLRGFDLMRVVMYADAIVMPVGSSVFDRESTADCYAELQKLPRVASGRCKVAAVGMRLDTRTRADELLRDWAAALQLPFIGVLRDTQAYVRCVERGLTLFDLPAAKVEADMRQWRPILDWLEPILQAENASTTISRLTTATTVMPHTMNGETTLSGPAGHSLARPAAPSFLSGQAARTTIASRFGKLMDALAVPRFLQR